MVVVSMVALTALLVVVVKMVVLTTAIINKVAVVEVLVIDVWVAVVIDTLAGAGIIAVTVVMIAFEFDVSL